MTEQKKKEPARLLVLAQKAIQGGAQAMTEQEKEELKRHLDSLLRDWIEACKREEAKP